MTWCILTELKSLVFCTNGDARGHSLRQWSGPIIEVLFEEIFAIQRNVCTFVLTCYVNNIERIRHFSPN